MLHPLAIPVQSRDLFDQLKAEGLIRPITVIDVGRAQFYALCTPFETTVLMLHGICWSITDADWQALSA